MIFGWRPDVALFATLPAPHLLAPVGEMVAKMAQALGLTPSTAWFGYLAGAGTVEGRAAMREQVLASWCPATRPRFVVALGGFTADVLGPAPVGTWFEIDGVPGLSSFHPAALLDRPDLKPAAWDHLKDLRRRLGASAAAA